MGGRKKWGATSHGQPERAEWQRWRRRWAAGVPGASDRHYGTPRLPCSDQRAAGRTCAAVGPLCALALLLVTPGALLPAAGRAAPCFLPIARPRAPLGPPDQVLRSTVPFCSRRSPPISQSDAWMGSNCGERRAAAMLCAAARRAGSGGSGDGPSLL